MLCINKIKVFLILGLSLVHYANGYSGGAPAGVCSTMVPGHGGSPQSTPSPYTIELDKSEVLGGETVKVLLQGSRPFKGFLVQGHKQLENYANIQGPSGKFSSPRNQGVKSVNCGGVSLGGMTHSSSDEKTQIELEWNAPTEEGNYVLLASFVEDYSTFWIKQVSPTIRVRKNTNVVAEEEKGAPKLSAETETLLNSYYTGCGQTKGCFGIPNGCIDSKTCDLFTTFRVDGSKYVFQVSGSLPAETRTGYVATGLSFDAKMGNDSVIACLLNPSTGQADVYSYYTEGKRIGFLRDRFAGLNINIPAKTKYLDNRLFCEFTRVPQIAYSEMRGANFDLDNEDYYMIVAKGTYENEGRLNYHGPYSGVSSRKMSFRSYPQQKPIGSNGIQFRRNGREKNYELIYDGCGITKGCFGMPSNCVGSKSCEAIVTFDSEFNFQLMGKLVDEEGQAASQGHVSVGLSADQKMGDDSVIGCTLNSGRIAVNSYFNDGKSNTVFANPRLGLESDDNVKNTFTDGWLYCEFKRTTSLVSDEIGTEYHLDIDQYYILLARGLEAEHGVLKYHTLGRASAPASVNLKDKIIVGEGQGESTTNSPGDSTTNNPTEEFASTTTMPFDDIYDGCGTEKGCFGMPSNCVRSKSCDTIVTFNSEFNFQLKGKLVDSQGNPSNQGHVSVALSADQLMGDDSVIGCTYNGANIAVKSYYNTDPVGSSNKVFTNPRLGLEMDENVKNSYSDGWLYCEFKRSPTLNSDEILTGTRYNLETDKYHILLAKAGSLEPDGGLGYHGPSGRLYAPETVYLKDIVIVGEDENATTQYPPTPIPFDEIYDGCTTNKGCFGIPKNCVDTKECKLFTSFNSKYEFKVLGYIGDVSQGHVSTGLSFDDKMGEDSIVGCVLENGRVETRTYYNIKGKNNNVTLNPNHGLDGQGSGKYIDGWLFCEFKRKELLKDENNEIGGDIDLANGNYHIIMAKATSISPNKLGYHELESDRGVTPQAVHMTHIGILGSKSNILTQLHGGFMIIAWLICASTGMFTARYYKQTHTDFNPFNKAFWFVLHVTCMFSTVFLTICGIIFIFIEVGGYSEVTMGPGKAHPILGFILLGLAVTQVIIAFFRPHPGTSRRPLFNWIHWTIGNSAHIVGIACIFLAPELPKSGLKDSGFWYPVVAFVIFHVGMHVVMSIHTVWADKRMDTENKMRAVRPGPMKPSGKAEEAPGAGFRSFMLILYITGAALVGIILVLLVAKVI